MKKLTWLHISDFHFRSETEKANNVIRNAFLDDVSSFCNEKNLNVNLIFVTGDLSFSGEQDQFHIAGEFFDKLLGILNCPKNNLYIVPGNHDVIRQKTLGVLSSNVSSLLLNREKLSLLLLNKEECGLVSARQESFVRFVKEYFHDIDRDITIYESPYRFVSKFQFNDYRISILGLNSSWLSASDSDKGNLVVGEEILQELLTDTETSDLRIALIHHPLNYLKEFDETDIKSLLDRSVDFVLRGHLHKTKAELKWSPDSKVMEIASGALCVNRNFPNAYNLISIDLVSKEATFFSRRYSDEAGGHFAKDVMAYKAMKDGEYNFSLTKSVHSSIKIKSRLAPIATNLLDQAGRRRTAYPTDMNFKELYDNHIFVTPRFNLMDGSATNLSIDDLIQVLFSGKNALVVGDPGTGKSFLTYLIQRHLEGSLPSEESFISIPIDLRLLPEIMNNEEKSIRFVDVISSLEETALPNHEASLLQDFRSERVIFVIDGIDEVVGNTSYLFGIRKLVDCLGEVGGVLVTCRTRDFEQVFAPILETSLFDTIVTIREWNVDVEFSEFIKNLNRVGKFDDRAFFQKVKNIPTLKSLASRPLYARMLTFINRQNSFREYGISELYAEYLGKFATVVDTKLTNNKCLRKPETYGIWNELAWFIFQSNLFVYDKIPNASLIKFIIEHYKMSQECANRLVQPIFNFYQIYHSTYAQFVHYSFFEYLVAEHMATELRNRHIEKSKDLFSLFQRDMSYEIRHFLMENLNKTKSKGLGKWLVEGYIAINETAPSEVDRMIANNLLVYILGRLNEDVASELKTLLKSEQNTFLKSSLYWGLCATGGVDAVKEYINVLDNSLEMRNLNRGYSLYYYSDIEKSNRPPYLDNNPNKHWKNTRLQTLRMKSNGDYCIRVPAARRAIDLYTFYDFCIFRSEKISNAEQKVLLLVLESIKKDLSDPHLVDRLFELHKQILVV